LSKCLLRHDVVRVFVSFLVLVFVRAILSWCPLTWHIYIVYNILCLNISSSYIKKTRWNKTVIIQQGSKPHSRGKNVYKPCSLYTASETIRPWHCHLNVVCAQRCKRYIVFIEKCWGINQCQRHGDNTRTIIYFAVVKYLDKQWNINLFHHWVYIELGYKIKCNHYFLLMWPGKYCTSLTMHS